MLYHYTFNAYLGINILEDKEIRAFLFETFNKIADSKGFRIVECEILADHVHMLIDQPYCISTSSAMKYIKGASARYLFKKFPANRFDIRKLWSRSFHCRKISEKQKERQKGRNNKIFHYIKKGYSYGQIVRIFHLSRQRIHQIFRGIKSRGKTIA